jgi:hypothetical protein
MKLPKINLEPAPSAAGSPPPRSFWNSVLSITPVMLTVVATILAGLSSSAMTLAQYHRALAAQNQSKVSDQWNFFQAKRIRGTQVHENLRLLQALSEPAPFETASLSAATDLALRDLRRLTGQADRLVALVGSARANLGPAGTPLQQAAARLAQAVAEKTRETELSRQRVQEELAGAGIQQVVATLRSGTLPAAATRPLEDAAVRDAVRAVRDRKPESDTSALVSRIPEETLRQAVQIVEDNVQAIEQANKPLSRTLERLEVLVREQAVRARDLARAVQTVNDAVADLPSGDTGPLAEVRAAAAGVARSGGVLKEAVGRLSTDFLAAQDAFTTLRYEQEARANEEAAALYEVQVRKSGIDSERHRTRSKHFFYGMLAAQAGVTIASFALAVRYKNLLWALASLAGIGAVAFAAYVYLYT